MFVKIILKELLNNRIKSLNGHKFTSEQTFGKRCNVKSPWHQ